MQRAVAFPLLFLTSCPVVKNPLLFLTPCPVVKNLGPVAAMGVLINLDLLSFFQPAIPAC